MKIVRGMGEPKINGNRAINRHRPGVVGTAYTTVNVVNSFVFNVCRISEGALNSVNCEPYLPFRGPSFQIPTKPFFVSGPSISKTTGVAFSRLPTLLWCVNGTCDTSITFSRSVA